MKKEVEGSNAETTTVEKVAEPVTVTPTPIEAKPMQTVQTIVEQKDRTIRFKPTQTYEAYIGGKLYSFKKDVSVVIPQSVAVMQSNNGYGFIY